MKCTYERGTTHIMRIEIEWIDHRKSSNIKRMDSDSQWGYENEKRT